MKIIQRPSPNFNARKDGKTAQYVLLHFTAMENAEVACERLCNSEIEVSAHYVLAENGDVFALVDEHMRAWHAGASFWAGEEDLNSASIGIEIDNNGAQPFREAQYQALVELVNAVRSRHDIPAHNVLGHQDVAIGRKFDPGPWFDWARLDAEAVARAPHADIKVPKSEEGFRALAASAGYKGDAELSALLMTVRMRHGSTPYFGPLRASDFKLLNK